MKRHRTLLRVAGVGAITLVVGVVAIRHLLRPRTSQWEEVIVAARQWRPADGRLSGGFHWTSQASTGGVSLTLRSAASSLMSMFRGRSDAEAQRMVAAAAFTSKGSSAAQALLEQAVRAHPQNALLWSDLAAARMVTAMEQQRAADLPLALAAADRAIELSPNLPEARFNRAAILAHLGLRDSSCAEWEAYLDREPTGEWATEAARRLCELDEHLDGKLAIAETLSADTVTIDSLRTLLAAFPQETRAHAETVLFSQWAAAEQKNDPMAATLLSQLRMFATLFEQRGEHLLADAVSAAEQAQRDPRRKALLIEAYLTFLQGRMLQSKLNPVLAEPLLRRATTLFRDAESPMAFVAEYYFATTFFDQNRVTEARPVYIRLYDTSDRTRHRALTAQILWQLALCDSYEGAWSGCISRIREAHALFVQLGETTNSAFSDAILAEAYDRMARVEDGWRHRVGAFAVLSRLTDRSRLAAALNGAIRAEGFRHQHESALALSSVAIDESRRAGSESLVAEAYTRRALVLREAGDRERALAAIADARKAANANDDEKLRLRATADTDVIEGSIVRAFDPQRAIALLTNAIDFYTQQHHDAWLPAARLERGRAYKAMRQTREALADFEEAIREIERQRSSIEESELRSGFFDTVPDLFAEAVDLLIASGKTDAAFAMAERARARTLYEQLGITKSAPDPDSAQQIRKRLAPDEIIVEFQLLPNGVAIFCLDQSELSVVRTTLDTAQLRQKTAELIGAVRNDRVADARNAGVELWRSLLAPVADRIDRAKRLVLVPDRFLHAVPFPALVDARTSEYLVQRHELVLSPRGSFGDLPARPLRLSPALVIGDPTNPSAQEPRLHYAAAEARKIASLYGTEPLLGNNATRDALLAKAPLSALIHYAGHARDGDDTNESHLILAGAGKEEILDASEIARLPLNNTSLVVLAACGTLSGDPERVEGMPSLARAFLAAGVPTVVGTLWDVPDDSTASFFLDFHKRLNAGVYPVAALREAQLAQLQSANQEKMTWATIAIIGQR
ncbi:MAG TPA: CHAT domain-containing protein [Thermoanaerobaculia bacterium]|nr:CHAT domain-containing protein [Thermoanaerobaculia bacterium]